MKPRAVFLKINKIDKLLDRLIKKKKEVGPKWMKSGKK